MVFVAPMIDEATQEEILSDRGSERSVRSRASSRASRGSRASSRKSTISDEGTHVYG